MRMLRAGLLGGAWMASLAVPAGAHDLWIIPGSFRPRPGSAVALELRIGEKFPVSMNGPRKESLTRLALVGAAGETPIEGAEAKGKVLAARFTAPSGGTAAIVLEGTPRHIELKPEEFKSYVTHEGLPHIHEERLRRGETDRPGREDYSRHAKALIRSGPGESAATRPAGLKLEAVPAVDPYELVPSQPLPVKVLFDGRPLPGIELRAYTEGATAPRVKTGADGTARLALDRPGVWCVAFIHMIRCSECPQADWRSYFGSLTFELKAP